MFGTAGVTELLSLAEVITGRTDGRRSNVHGSRSRYGERYTDQTVFYIESNRKLRFCLDLETAWLKNFVEFTYRATRFHMTLKIRWLFFQWLVSLQLRFSPIGTDWTALTYFSFIGEGLIRILSIPYFARWLYRRVATARKLYGVCVSLLMDVWRRTRWRLTDPRAGLPDLITNDDCITLVWKSDLGEAPRATGKRVTRIGPGILLKAGSGATVGKTRKTDPRI